GYNTLWPQVHASRGCPHNCDYCAVVRHFGRNVRKRTPENVIEDMKQAIEFHERKRIPRMSRVLWFTDDNFFADREWAISVLNAIIGSGIKYSFTVQARYEIGFDDEMLKLLKKAGFIEIAMGIEFLEDEAFEEYHKKSSYNEIVKSIHNIQKYDLNVRGLFIVGADNHEKGVGDRIVDFVLEHDIHGILIQSMYFVPGTPVYEMNKDRLLHRDWSKYNGNVVHYPKNISPYDLQCEIIHAIDRLYSVKRLIHVLRHEKWLDKVMYIGEYFWQKSVRTDLKNTLQELKRLK
ncbi:MAG: radical SAM protein, partial [Bacillota bacterium]